MSRLSPALGLLCVLAVFGVDLPVIGARAVASVGTYPERETIPAEVYLPNAAKRVACFLTINSVEEKNTFTKYLNPADWDLVELVGTTPNSPTSGWIDAVCKSGLKCDIEVVSGHFAGNFFGKSGFTLSLEEMTTHSCANDCSGILNHPREVYLFGCNTLAGKDHDSRTPKEYYDILIADGIPRDQAARIVEDRYSPFGQDNRGKMQRSFAGVPYLYGFYSKGPLGAGMEPILHRYFKQLGDYTAHFDRIVSEGRDATRNPNEVIGKLLANSNFYQAPGLDPKGPEYDALKPICELSDARTPINDRMDVAIKLLNSEKIISYLPSLETFFRKNYVEIRRVAMAKLDLIRGLTKPKETLLSSIDSVFLFATKLRWVRFAREIGWLDDSALDARLRELVGKKFAEVPLDSGIGGNICGIGYHSILSLDFSAVVDSLREEHWRSRSAIQAMGCIGLARYPRFKEKLVARLASRSSRTKEDTFALSTLYGNISVTTPDASDRTLFTELLRACDSAPDSTSVTLCPAALGNLAPADAAARTLALKILNSASPRAQSDATPEFMAFEDPAFEIETAFTNLALTLPMPFGYGAERFFEGRSVRESGNRTRIWDRVRESTRGNRRLTGLLFAVRDLKVDPALVHETWQSARGSALVETGEKFLLSIIKLVGQNGGTDAQLLEGFRANRFAILGFGPVTAELYGALSEPRMKQHLRRVPESAAILCEITAQSAGTQTYDAFGEVVPRRTPMRDCHSF